ncbi:MAG: selenide, water dikinase SelD [Kiritimatiellaeota bacterium]|nr:selenide, water dikinase SelD [Kiritimatiellota bacterium]
MGREKIKLTQYSHGAGCGCKISPSVLDAILAVAKPSPPHPNLLVGNDSRDDAAAYDLGNGTSVLSTTDFFMPIVDDPFTFGRIAATNSLSDIYAMGGKPLMAISIFGWPIDKLSAEIAGEVIEGGRSVCDDAGIPLAGGHSIDAPEPIFGLAVTGLVENTKLKRNDTAEVGCELFLTKPVGIGILTTAQKMGVIDDAGIQPAIDAMCALNKIGAEIAEIDGVAAMTDVTGFALLGHLCEMCEGAGVSARLNVDDIPLLPEVGKYLDMECVPGGTYRNFQSYGDKISTITERRKEILCDPQTSGGLLVAVKPKSVGEFLETTAAGGLDLAPIGEIIPGTDKLVEVECCSFKPGCGSRT